jgi:hypothetical protein
MIRMLFARLWRWLFWSKEDRKKLGTMLASLDEDLEMLEDLMETYENKDN